MNRPREKQRTDETFRAFYDAHVGALSGFARRWSGSDAEDLVAETFIRSYRSLDPGVWSDHRQSRAWLFRVLRNLQISAARRRSTAARSQHLIASPSQVEFDARMPSELDDALVQLDERKRLVLELRFVADLDVPSTAEVLDTTEEAVRALTYRSLRELRRHLETPATPDHP